MKEEEEEEKKKKEQQQQQQPDVLVHAYNPSIWETETGGSQVHSQPQQPCEAFRNLVRPCFKIKNKIGLGV